MRTALEGIEEQMDLILEIANAFERVYNKELYDELLEIYKGIRESGRIAKGCMTEFANQRLESAQQDSVNVLSGVIAGTEVGRRDKIITQRLAEYCSHRREEDYFRNQLCDGSILPATGVDVDEWEGKKNQWQSMEDDDEDAIELFNWLALNSTGHVYAYARQILNQ